MAPSVRLSGKLQDSRNIGKRMERGGGQGEEKKGIKN
jgi:hypothetical protein